MSDPQEPAQLLKGWRSLEKYTPFAWRNLLLLLLVPVGISFVLVFAEEMSSYGSPIEIPDGLAPPVSVRVALAMLVFILWPVAIIAQAISGDRFHLVFDLGLFWGYSSFALEHNSLTQASIGGHVQLLTIATSCFCFAAFSWGLQKGETGDRYVSRSPLQRTRLIPLAVYCLGLSIYFLFTKSFGNVLHWVMTFLFFAAFFVSMCRSVVPWRSSRSLIWESQDPYRQQPRPAKGGAARRGR